MSVTKETGPDEHSCEWQGRRRGSADCTGIPAGSVIVVVPSSSAEQLEQVCEELHDYPSEDVVTIFGDIGRFDEAERIREVLLVRVGRLDAVVSSLGRGCHGPSWVEASFEMRERASGEHLTPQCVIPHAFLPLLIAQEYDGYTLVERSVTECALQQAVLSAIVGAAHNMLVRVLSEEFADTHGRVNESLVCPDISVRKRARDPPEGFVDDWKGTVTAWLASEEAAPVRGATIRFVEGESIIPDDIIS